MSTQEGELAGRSGAPGPRPGCRFDDAGLAAVYRDHHGAISAVARLVCGPEQAADVTQDVFADLWRHPDSFDPARGPLRPFLLAVAHNKAVDVVRSETARQARERRDLSADVQFPAEVDDHLLRDEVAARVRDALAGLPPTEREAITTAFDGGHSYRRVAALLGEPEGTIKSRIRSGLRRLHATLADLAADPT